MECPVPLQKISVIEQLNSFRINVFGYEEDEVCLLYISEKQNPGIINFLLVGDGEKQHYCLKRSFSRLLGNLINYEQRCVLLLSMPPSIFERRSMAESY